MVDRKSAKNYFSSAIIAVRENGSLAIKLSEQSEGRGDRARRYYKAWSHLLQLYSSPLNFEGAFPINTLPPDLTLQMQKICEHLGRGIIPDPIAHCARPGNLVGPDEEQDIRQAVAYVLAAKRGLIADNKPVNTIKTLFGCKDRKSVQGWVSKYGSSIKIEDLENSRTVEKKMKRSAQRYSIAGRSHATIRNRAKT